MTALHLLLLGSGGREHAFAWKLRQSPLCAKLWIAPGNAGTAELGENIAIQPTDFEAIKNFVIRQNIQLVIVGPEEPLVRGIYDYFKATPALADVDIVAPSAAGAMLEGSKAYAKAFMQQFDIPTAAYREFTAATLAEGIAYLATQPAPYVLKADGLAAGKGVLIIQDLAEAQAALAEMLGGKFGSASEKVVIEAFLSGVEFSVFALTDGTRYQLLPVAKDYKRIGEGDTGLNTGGMGAVSPVPFADADLMDKVVRRIVAPTIAGIATRGLAYQGFVFFGLISVKGEPYVIEYNCRMGDPETEVVLPRLQTDLVQLCLDAARHQVGNTPIAIDPRAATTVFLVSGGYPEAYNKGKSIGGLQLMATDALVFHAGTARTPQGELVTAGGRVIAVTAFGNTLPQAIAAAQAQAANLTFEGKYFRRDIGRDVVSE